MARPHEDPGHRVMGSCNIDELMVGDKVFLDAGIKGITSVGAQEANVTKIDKVEFEGENLIAVQITTTIYINPDDRRSITVIQ